MKRYNLKFFTIICSLILLSCESETKFPEFTQTILPKITVDNSGDAVIAEPSEFNGKLVVDLYFKDIPETAILVIAKNGNYKDVKEFKPITSFPTNVDVTGADIEAVFGKITGGDYYEFGLKTTYQGQIFNPFNPYGISYSSDLRNMPGSSPIVKFTAICPFNIDDFVGTFQVEDEFWEEEYTVTISKVSDTQLQVDGMLAGDAEFPMFIDVDPVMQIATITNQVLISSIFGYTNLKYSGTGDVNACDISMSFEIEASVDQGTFDTGMILKFTKK